MLYCEFNRRVYDALLRPGDDGPGAVEALAIAGAFNTGTDAASVLIGIEVPENIGGIPDDWNVFCRSVGGVPYYLGLIAIQVHVAAERHNDADYTARAYNPRLAEYLGCECQALGWRYAAAQEWIYADFKDWCDENGLLIYLPESREGNGRYVQYPLSLSLLNREDAESLGNSFRNYGFTIDDNIDFKSFWGIIGGSPNTFTDRIANRLRNLNPPLSEILKRQIYYHYLHWDGSYTPALPVNGKSVRRINGSPPQFYSLTLEERDGRPSVSFYKIGENDSQSQVGIGDLPRRIVAGSFFAGDEVYENYFYFISPGAIECGKYPRYAYVCRGATEVSLYISNHFPEDKITTIYSGGIKIFKFDCECMKRLMGDCPNLFPAISLTGGIRFKKRAQCWMEGAGPLLENRRGENHYVFLETLSCHGAGVRTSKREKKEINAQPLIDLAPGWYRIFFSDADPAIYFKIESVERGNNFPYGGGWIHDDNGFQLASPSREADICGIDFSSLPAKSGNVVRQWMELASGRSPDRCANENVIHDALRRTKDGIRLRKS